MVDEAVFSGLCLPQGSATAATAHEGLRHGAG
jgi:hypothetical protein